MWCPICKNEYVEGITRCADCNVDLVDTLHQSAAEPVVTESESDEPSVAASRESLEPESASNSKIPDASSHAYISKRTKQEDIKSTAYTFTLISILGILFLVLFALDVLPLHTAFYMKIMICVVMGTMFAIFLFIGIRSFGELKVIATDADEEERLLGEITEWFLKAYNKDVIDASCDTQNQSEEQLYFLRYDVMNHLIVQKYPDLEESFLDHVIESIYNDIFSA